MENHRMSTHTEIHKMANRAMPYDIPSIILRPDKYNTNTKNMGQIGGGERGLEIVQRRLVHSSVHMNRLNKPRYLHIPEQT